MTERITPDGPSLSTAQRRQRASYQVLRLMEDFRQHQVEQGMRRYRRLFRLPGAFSHTNIRRITPSVCSDLIADRDRGNPRCGTGLMRRPNGPYFQQHEGHTFMQTTIKPILSNAPCGGRIWHG